jgi:anti-sigma B factor antagonist
MNLSVQEKIENEKEITYVVSGEIDVYTAPKLREKLLPRCQGGTTITIDFTDVEYIDSTGLSVLIGAYKAQGQTGGKLILKGMNARLQRIFRITNLNVIMLNEEKVKEDGRQ